MTLEPTEAAPVILVVDDDPSTRVLLKKVLIQSGFAVDLAAGGEEAIRLTQGREYAVILLDLVMPQPDGLAVLRHLRSTTPSLLQKIIIITGYPQQAVSTDACAILTKPLDVSEVLRRTRQCMQL
jgi:phosphoserine phosphatase RsbU/P